MIRKRKKDMKQSDFINKGDFLTMLLEDSLFSENEENMIDECLTFLFAAT